MPFPQHLSLPDDLAADFVKSNFDELPHRMRFPVANTKEDTCVVEFKHNSRSEPRTALGT
jgi:hypothetical protein